MNNKNTNVPKLRFKGFNDAWQVKKLGDVAKISTGNSNREDSSSDSGKYTFFDRSKDIRTSNIFIFDGEAVIVAGEGQDFIPKYFFGKFDLHQRTYAIMNFLNSSCKFIFYYIHKNKNYFLSQAVGSTVKSLRLPMFQIMPISLPSKKEQQKIAACLTSLDDLITAQTQKLDNLKTHKKGLMQNLFPATNTTTPKLRFFGFSGNWQEKPLEKVATFHKGKGVSKLNITINGAQPCIRYGELYTSYGEVIRDIISYTNILGKDLVLSNANDVIIPSSGETQIDIARASCVINSGIALGGDLNIIRSKINGIFLSYYLNSAKKKSIASFAQGISVVHLYSSQLKKLYINFPNRKEQQKIADCLTSLDDLITAQTQKITTLKTHKKGLMQNLFPAN